MLTSTPIAWQPGPKKPVPSEMNVNKEAWLLVESALRAHVYPQLGNHASNTACRAAGGQPRSDSRSGRAQLCAAARTAVLDPSSSRQKGWKRSTARGQWKLRNAWCCWKRPGGCKAAPENSAPSFPGVSAARESKRGSLGRAMPRRGGAERPADQRQFLPRSGRALSGRE